MPKKTEYQDKWERSPGYVYFIAAGEPVKAVKIGVTVQRGIKRRLRGLQSANHEPLKILGVIPFEGVKRPMLAAEKKERELHQKFAHLQRFEKGWVGSEWFSVTPKLLEEIKRISVRPMSLGIVASLAKPGPGSA